MAKCDFPRDDQGNPTGEGCAVHGYLELRAGEPCPERDTDAPPA